MANSIPFDAWSIDDAFCYQTRVVGLQDDLAIYELNEKFEQGRLRLRWRRTDPADLKKEEKEGVVPAASWLSGMLRVSRDFNRNEVDWAIGKVTAENDGRAFIANCVGEDPGRTYELTVLPRDVRMLWPALQPQTNVESVQAPVEEPQSGAETPTAFQSTTRWFEWATEHIPPGDWRRGWKTRYTQKLEPLLAKAAKNNPKLTASKAPTIYTRLNEHGLWPEPPAS
jgi:hypothetical protein